MSLCLSRLRRIIAESGKATIGIDEYIELQNEFLAKQKGGLELLEIPEPPSKNFDKDQFTNKASVFVESLSMTKNMSEWMPIDSAPRDGRMAIVYRPLAELSGDDMVAIKRLIDTNNYCWPCTVPDGHEAFNPTDGCCHVTHWIPLPLPPTEGEQSL